MRPVSSRFLQSSSSFGRASHSPRMCVRENGGGERESEREAFSHERVRSSRPLALRFFHPFFLSPPFSLSFIERLPLGLLRSLCSCLFFFLCRSLPLAFSAVLSLTGLSSVSLIFLLSLGGGASFSVVLVFRVVLFLFFLPSSCSPAGGSFSVRVHTRESNSPPQPRRLRRTVPPFAPPFRVLFCPLSIVVFCTLRI